MPLKRKELLATLQVHGDEPVYSYAIVRGRAIIESGQAQPQELANLRVSRKRYALLCPDAVLSNTTVTVPSKNKKVIDLLVRRNIDQDIHLGSGYTLLHHKTGEQEDKSDFDYLAISAKDMAWVQEHIPINDAPVQNIGLVEHAISALIYRACKDPVIAFWAKDNKLLGLLLVNNRILARRLSLVKNETLEIEFDEGLEITFEEDSNVHSHYKDALSTMHKQLSSIAKNNHNIEDYVPIALGDLVNELAKDALCLNDSSLDFTLPETQALSQSMIDLYQVGENNPSNEILLNPQLYGLSYVSPTFNLCPNDYQHQVRAFNIGYYTAPAVALLGALLFCSAVFTGYNSSQQRNQLQNEIVQLAPNIQDINTRAPNSTALKKLSQTTQLLKKEQLLLRTDNFLNWVSRIFVGHARITALYIAPEQDKRKHRASAGRGSPAKPKATGRYKVSIEANIDARYAKSKMTAENLVWALGLRSEIIESAFHFDADLTSQPKGRLSVSFIATAKDFLELR